MFKTVGKDEEEFINSLLCDENLLKIEIITKSIYKQLNIVLKFSYSLDCLHNSVIKYAIY